MAYGNIAQITGWQNRNLNALSNRIGNEAEETIEQENESRVAQMREMRRMEHERYLEQMKIDALLKKLQLEAQIAQQANVAKFGPGPRTISFRGGSITHG